MSSQELQGLQKQPQQGQMRIAALLLSWAVGATLGQSMCLVQAIDVPQRAPSAYVSPPLRQIPTCTRRSSLVMKAPPKVGQNIRKVCATNKFARSNYEIAKTFEAGISLVGTEVGPITGGSCQMRDSYCRVKDGELFIFNLFIGQHKTTGKYFNHEEKRPRRLLVHKKEIIELKMESQRSGYTIVPLRVYMTQEHKIKVEIGLGLGKKKYDKREAIKAKELKRGFERILKAF